MAEILNFGFKICPMVTTYHPPETCSESSNLTEIIIKMVYTLKQFFLYCRTKQINNTIVLVSIEVISRFTLYTRRFRDFILKISYVICPFKFIINYNSRRYVLLISDTLFC